MSSKKQLNKRFLIEGLIAVIIALSPILLYSYKYYPIDTDTLDFFFFEIRADGFADARTALWYHLIKLTPLILLILWFITCKEWWYHAILIPISMYSFQLYTVLSTSYQNIDESEILYVVAVTMVIIPVVYFIRIKLVDKYIYGIDLKAMDTELQILKAKEELRKEREKLEQRKETLSKKM